MTLYICKNLIKYSPLTILIVCCLSLKSQYTFLHCEGPVPNVIKENSTKKAISRIKSINDNGDKNSETKLEKSFTIQSTFIDDAIFQSGKLLYGDTCTKTIQKIANRLLKNDTSLLRGLNFFTIRSSMVNAFSTHSGYIVVTTSLLARIENEAELAFILSHEISHFVQKHQLNSAKISYKISSQNKSGFETKMRELYKYSQNNELEADSLGMLMFIKAGYDAQNAINAISLLGHINESFSEIPFNDSIFQSENFTFDNKYKLDKKNFYSVKSSYKTNYPEKHYSSSSPKEVDEESTHPAIHLRKNQLTRIKDKINSSVEASPSYIAIDSNTFISIKKQAQLEETLGNIRDGDFIAGIYNSYILEKKYGIDNLLLDIRAMCYYGLAFHSISVKNEIDKFGVRVNRSPGLHQLSGFYMELSPLQTTLLGIRMIWTDINKTKENAFRYSLLDSMLKLIYRVPDFHPENIKLNLKPVKPISKGDNYYVFNDITDAEFMKIFNSAKSRYQNTLTNPNNESFASKSFLNKLSSNLLGYKYYKPMRLGIDSLIIFTPMYYSYRITSRGIYQNGFSDEYTTQILRDDCKKYADEMKMNVKVLNNFGDSSITTNDVNQYAVINDWLEECANNGFAPMRLFYGSRMNESRIAYNSNVHIASIVNIVSYGRQKQFKQILFVYKPATSSLAGINIHIFRCRAKLDFIRAHNFEVLYELHKQP